MSAWILSFQRLRWKLTVRSMLVTVGALLVVVLVLGALLLSRVFIPLEILNTSLSPANWLQIIRNDSPDLVRAILAQDPVDTALISTIMQEGELQVSFSELLRVGDIELQLRTVGQGSTLLLDHEGTLLGTSNTDLVPQEAVGSPLDPSILPGLEGPLEAAMQGDLNADQLYVTIEPNEKFYLAVPIHDEAIREVIGVLIVYVDNLPTENDFVSNTLALMGRSAFILLLAAALVGLIFGFVTAKGMVDRLQHASDVTDAWSQGDFTEFIEDPVHDEIGQLGERLNRMAKQLKELLRRREEIAVVEERNRLARDLHDSAKQQALAASFQIGTALTLYERDPGTARGHLEEAERLVDSVRGELTDLIMELRPQDFEEKSIDLILSDYLLEWSQQHDIEVDQDVSKNLQVSNGGKQTLLRILQEALANIARHSQAKRIEIYLGVVGDETVLKIRDNGVGFESQKVTRGVGLRSMHERAESLGGRLEVSSAPGEGTTLKVYVPYQGKVESS